MNSNSQNAKATTTATMIPDIKWVTVPAGKFFYGLGKDQKGIDLAEFGISPHLITNRQYECFVLAGGYEQDEWWTEGKGIEDRPAFERSHWPQPTRPKTDVNWYEAMAYCAWLNSFAEFESVGTVSLLHEQQWEIAGGRHKGDVFAWGSDDDSDIEKRANVAKNLDQTSTVGMYPQGDSIIAGPGKNGQNQRVSDLSGNVWEWCLNGYDDLKSRPSKENFAVLRGGSWFNRSVYARARFRFRRHPGSRFNFVGIRVCCSLPSGH